MTWPDRRSLFWAAGVAVLMVPAAACFSSTHAPSGEDAGAQDASADHAAPAVPDATVDAMLDAGTVADSAAPDASTVSESGAVDASVAAEAAVADAAVAEAAPPMAGHVFFTSEATGDLLALATDASGGLGSQLAGSPFGTGEGYSYAVTGNLAGTRVYVGVINGSTGDGYVAAFALDANGNVSGKQTGSPFATGVVASPTRVVVNPAGTRLYVVHQGAAAGSIAVFALDAMGNVGALRPGSPFGTGTGTFGASVNPNGTRLYVTSQEKRGVFVFQLDANGDITSQTSGSPFLTGLTDAPLLSVVHPSGGQLYVTDQNNNLVVFTLDASGDITGQSSGSPFATTTSCGLAINTAGTRLYVGTNGPALDVFTLAAATGAVQDAAVPFTVGVGTSDLSENLAQNDLYVVDTNNSRVASVSLNASGDPQSAQGGPSPDGGMYPFGVYAR